jgi:hypothetical protein
VPAWQERIWLLYLCRYATMQFVPYNTCDAFYREKSSKLLLPSTSLCTGARYWRAAPGRHFIGARPIGTDCHDLRCLRLFLSWGVPVSRTYHSVSVAQAGRLDVALH